MQSIARNGYSEAQVLAALQGRYGSRKMEARYELLNEDNVLLDNLSTVLSGSVSYDSLADIKRTAKFSIKDDGAIDFLSHRIKPWMRLYMPDQAIQLPGMVRVSPSYEAAVGRVRQAIARWTFDDLAGSIAYDSIGGFDLTLSVGATPNQAPLVEDDGRSLALAIGSSAASELGGSFLNGVSSLSFVGWFQTPNVGDDATLIETTQGNTWGDNASQTWGEFAASGVWGDDALSTNGLKIVFVGATKRIRVQLYVNNQLVTAETPVNTQTALPTMLGFTWTSGGQMSIYLDGELVASVDNAPIGSISEVAGLRVGGVGFEGRVDDFLFATTVVPDDVMYDLFITGAAVGPAAPPERRYVEWPQGVFLLSSPERSADENGVVTRDVDAYDQLVVLQAQFVPEAYYVAEGAIYTEAIDELLSNTSGLPSYQIVPSTKTLPALRMWEAGTSHLRIVQDLISAINYEALFFDENGTAIVQPYIAPQDRRPEYQYLPDEVSVLIPGATQSLDLYSQPNQWSLVVSEPDRLPLVATFTNNDPTNPTSTVNRGRVISDVRSETEAVDLVTLQAKVERLAQEATQVYETVEFRTALMPFHTHRDVYRLAYPDLGIDDNYSETKWSYDLTAGRQMSHSARRVVVLNGSLT